MRPFHPLLLVLALLLRLNAREVDIQLWISGGMQGVVVGNRECPGWLSVARQLEVDNPDACWIQLGGLPFTEHIAGLKKPDAVVPTESDFRLQGLSSLEKMPLPWTLLNVKALPQFPDYSPVFAPVQIWRQADGVEVHIFALLSDQAPLHIPADRIRPLQVIPALKTIRKYLIENPLPENAIPVLVLPEDADPAEWSAWLPEFPLLIEPADFQARVIEVQNGAQLRVKPARYGRAMIRVQLYWDTVTKRFRNPTAEQVWVRSPDLQSLKIPDPILSRLRPVETTDKAEWIQALMTYGNAALLPDVQPRQIDSKLPDAIRVAAFPEDHAWVRVRLSYDQWRRWKQAWQGASFDNLLDQRGEVNLMMPAVIAAGGGDPHSMIRQDLKNLDLQTQWMPFTSRDLILPLEQLTP